MNLKQRLRFLAKAFSPDSSEQTTPPKVVGELMTRDVVSLYPNQSFAEAIGVMASRPFRHILVIHHNGLLAGVISDRDLLRGMGGIGEWKEKKVSEVMSPEVVTVTPDTSLSIAVREILSHRINCLPVINKENKQVCGILTSTDLLKFFERLQTTRERLTD